MWRNGRFAQQKCYVYRRVFDGFNLLSDHTIYANAELFELLSIRRLSPVLVTRYTHTGGGAKAFNIFIYIYVLTLYMTHESW